MEVSLQILFFACIIASQVILITIIAKGFKILKGTVNFVKQESLMVETDSYEEHETGDKGGTGGETDDLYPTSESEELLFIKEVELNKEDPVTEINIIVDR